MPTLERDTKILIDIFLKVCIINSSIGDENAGI